MVLEKLLIKRIHKIISSDTLNENKDEIIAIAKSFDFLPSKDSFIQLLKQSITKRLIKGKSSIQNEIELIKLIINEHKTIQLVRIESNIMEIESCQKENTNPLMTMIVLPSSSLKSPLLLHSNEVNNELTTMFTCFKDTYLKQHEKKRIDVCISHGIVTLQYESHTIKSVPIYSIILLMFNSSTTINIDTIIKVLAIDKIIVLSYINELKQQQIVVEKNGVIELNIIKFVI